jgi:hypothetical protein
MDGPTHLTHTGTLANGCDLPFDPVEKSFFFLFFFFFFFPPFYFPAVKTFGENAKAKTLFGDTNLLLLLLSVSVCFLARVPAALVCDPPLPSSIICTNKNLRCCGCGWDVVKLTPASGWAVGVDLFEKL